MRAIHYIQLQAQDDNGAWPVWVHLLPASEFTGRDGRGPYQNTHPAAVLEAFANWGMPLAIDYHHQSLDAAEKTGPLVAAGWIHELDSRKDGIWGRVEWTERARQYIQAKELLYLSPVFDYDPKTGRVLQLVGAGLTNTPNLPLRAVASRRGIMDENLLVQLRSLLNLPETSTPEEIMQRLESLLEMSVATTTLQNAEPDPTHWVPRAQFDQVQATLATAQQQTAQHAVDEAVREGKIPPAMIPWARAYATRDAAGFAEYVAQAPKLVNSPPMMGAPPRATTPHALTDVEIARRARQHHQRLRGQGTPISFADAVDAVRANVDLMEPT